MLGRLFRRDSRAPVPLVLYTRPGCHLCDEMKAQIERARVARTWTLTEVDIDGDDALREAYDRSIPVLVISGRVAFKGRLTTAEFERKFERLAGQLPPQESS